MYSLGENKYTFVKFLIPFYGFINYQLQGLSDYVPLESTENYSLAYELFYSFFQVFFNLLLVFYFENIMPSEDDTQKHPLYFLDWFKRWGETPVL
jgi:hypothetical protein